MSFKICTIGCGGMATNYHGPSYARYAACHPNTELTACCDIDESRAVTFRERFGFARYYTDLASMLEVEKPDAVCLVVPEPLTCELACQILQRGHSLLMEKPPGRTVDEIDRIIAAADAGGGFTQVAFNRRYAPLVQMLKRLLTDRFLTSAIHHLCYDFTRIGRTDADFSLTAIHGIDAVRFLASSDYEWVRFHYQPFPDLGPTTANIFMDCTLASGATAHIVFCPVGGVVVERAAVHAQDHTFYLQIPVWNAFDSPGRLQALERGELKMDVAGTDLDGGCDEYVLSGFYDENASFFDAVREGRRPAGDLRDARQSVEIAQCLRERKAEYRYPS